MLLSIAVLTNPSLTMVNAFVIPCGWHLSKIPSNHGVHKLAPRHARQPAEEDKPVGKPPLSDSELTASSVAPSTNSSNNEESEAVKQFKEEFFKPATTNDSQQLENNLTLFALGAVVLLAALYEGLWSALVVGLKFNFAFPSWSPSGLGDFLGSIFPPVLIDAARGMVGASLFFDALGVLFIVVALLVAVWPKSK